MKKINVLQLIASLCLLFGSIINLVKTFTEIPLSLSICSLPLLLVSIILYGIVWGRKIKERKDTNKER